jgi:hypothetical protein
MLNWTDYLLWIAGGVAGLWVVARSIAERTFLRYLPLNLYLLAVVMVSVFQFLVIRAYGLVSPTYVFVYYYSDCVLTLFLYLVILGFYQQVFEGSQVSRHLRVAAAVVFGAVVLVTFSVVQDQKDHLYTRLVVGVSRNLYFIGMVLTLLLCSALVHMHETRLRLVQLVGSLGIYFSAYSATYALRYLFPEMAWLLITIPPMLGTGLAFAWAWAFVRVPDQARAVHRFRRAGPSFLPAGLRAAQPRTS